MNRKISIVYPLISPLEWATRYELNMNSSACVKCGKHQSPTIPFATGAWRGLEAELHGCGPSFRMAVAREITSSNDWAEIHSALKRLV